MTMVAVPVGHRPATRSAARVLLVIAYLTLLAGRISAETSQSGGEPPSVASVEADPRRQLAAASAWLWSRQAADGGWHSDTYRLLASGRALTPLVLEALSRVPEDVFAPSLEQRQRAVDFVRRQIDGRGVIGLNDPEVPEYPNYATALALKCLLRSGNNGDSRTIARMTEYLAAEQFSEARGFLPEHVAYGGFGFGGTLPLGGSSGHMDIAHTRHVLEALRDAQPRRDPASAPMDRVFARSEQFLRLLQRHPDERRPQPSEAGLPRPAGWRAPYDGGFYFSPVVLAANKGREAMHEGQPYFRSYSTATCEGVLALLAAGVPRDDQRLVRGAAWLRDHSRLDYPDGVPSGAAEPWGESIFFYHAAVRAQAAAAIDLPGAWRVELTRILAARQLTDGSFRNAVSHLMKEDDPLLATSLAISALCECSQAEAPP